MAEEPRYSPAESTEEQPDIDVPSRRETREELQQGSRDAETPRVERETTEKLDDLQVDITGQRMESASADAPKPLTFTQEKAAALTAAASGMAGKLGKIMEAFKKISDRLDPIRENLARALGPMLGAEIPGPLKSVLGVSSLGMLPMLENFTGKYGVFYKNLTKNKLKITDPQFSAKGFMAEYDAAVSEGLQIPFEEYVRRTAVHLHQQKGPGELTVNGNDLSAAAKTVVQAEKKPETQTAK